MFPLILQAHKFLIVTHNIIITLFLVPLNERESRGGQTVLLSVPFFVSEIISPAGFVSRPLLPAGRSFLPAGLWSRSFLFISNLHNLFAGVGSRFPTPFPTYTAYQNDPLQSFWYATLQNLSSPLLDNAAIINTYNLAHVLAHQPPHVQTNLRVVSCSTHSKCNHVVSSISSPGSILEDVLVLKIHLHYQCNEVFNACWQAHISPVKEEVTRFNQDRVESSFKETQK